MCNHLSTKSLPAPQNSFIRNRMNSNLDVAQIRSQFGSIYFAWAAADSNLDQLRWHMAAARASEVSSWDVVLESSK